MKGSVMGRNTLKYVDAPAASGKERGDEISGSNGLIPSSWLVSNRALAGRRA